MIAAMELDPTLGLYSATAAARGRWRRTPCCRACPTSSRVDDRLSDLDGLVAEWRTKAGDKMRGEFQDAIAAAKA